MYYTKAININQVAGVITKNNYNQIFNYTKLVYIVCVIMAVHLLPIKTKHVTIIRKKILIDTA